MAIVFVSTTASEGLDRSNLSLDDNYDELLAAVSSVNKNVVVVVTCPGAILTPWRD